MFLYGKKCHRQALHIAIDVLFIVGLLFLSFLVISYLSSSKVSISACVMFVIEIELKL